MRTVQGMHAHETDVSTIMRAATGQLAGLGARRGDALARATTTAPPRWRSTAILTVDLVLIAAIAVAIIANVSGASPSCPPLRYAFDRDSTPRNIAGDIDAAFATVASAAGMTMIDGPSEDGVIVSFVPLRIQEDGRRQVGQAWRPARATTDAPTGRIILDAEARLPAGTGERRSWQGLVMHEVGHLVGLEHSKSVNDVMYPSLDLGTAAWSEGERAQLAEIGRQLGCSSR